jgi:aminopeptidase YwaD
MKYFTGTLLFLFLSFGIAGTAQTVKFSQDGNSVTARIKKDLYILASDSFMGREAGTEGEIMARDYIISLYKSMGINPYFDGKSYTQSFSFKDSPVLGDSNELKVGKKSYELNDEFYPLSYSASSIVKGGLVHVGYGVIVPESSYDDYKNKTDVKGKIFVMETALPESYKQDTNFIKYLDLQKKIDTAIAKGAAGIIFVNSDILSNYPASKIASYPLPSSVPVIFVKDKSLTKVLSKKKNNTAEMKVDIERKIKTGYNVAAYIDNKASTTVIIGGHYDHIGMGKENSRYTGTELLVHNGADDNASGTAAVIELARYLKDSGSKKHNYLFMNFSGEEKGLYGSSYYTKSSYFDTTSTAYMLNMDMVGRYDTAKIGLDIIGTGTSPLWDTLIYSANKDQMEIKKTKSGFEGSDQMSFYLKNIPVLFLMTGIHSDYHMPSDDADKINFSGMTDIVKFAERLIACTDTIAKMPFAKTANDSKTRSTKFSVTLGIVPDHSYDGKGLRIEGVSPEKTAEKAGLKSGDVIIKMGDYEISEIMSYMKALGHFKKGDKTKVTVERNGETLTIDVEF